MSVLIKGMEMPTSCESCMFSRRSIHNIDWCVLTEKDLPCDCPLVSVPPHYDLIDHNALKIAVMDCDAETRLDFLKHAMDCINKAPVVIPSDMPTYEAEEGE